MQQHAETDTFKKEICYSQSDVIWKDQVMRGTLLRSLWEYVCVLLYPILVLVCACAGCPVSVWVWAANRSCSVFC